MTHLHIEAYDVIGFSDGAIVSLLLGLSDQRLKHIVSDVYKRQVILVTVEDLI